MKNLIVYLSLISFAVTLQAAEPVAKDKDAKATCSKDQASCCSKSCCSKGSQKIQSPKGAEQSAR